MNTLMLHDLTAHYISDVIKINVAGQPGVCALSLEQIEEHLAHARFFKVVMLSGECIAYVIAYDYQQLYDGDEFNWFKNNIGQPFLYIDQIAIAPTHQGQGWGGQIYDLLKELAANLHYKHLTCEVNLEPPNPISLKFHHQNGFITQGELVAGDGRRVALLALPI